VELGRKSRVLASLAGKDTRITSGDMGQLVEWLEVVTVGRTLEGCRRYLQDALIEMIAAHR
jgi:hypothetical protein